MIRLGLVGGFPSEETLAGSYQLECIGWIVLARLYRLDCIGISLGFARRNWIYALASLLLDGWDTWTGWDVGGIGVGWRDRR